MLAESVHILLVEDEPAHVELIRRAFEASDSAAVLSVASSIAEAHASLQHNTPPIDLIITDWRLPDGEGIDLLTIEPSARLHVPVVVMTSYGNERVAVEAMKSGALDYIVKNEVTMADMAHIAQRAIREWINLNERRQAEVELVRRNRELALLNRASQALGSTLDLDQLLATLLDEVRHLLDVLGSSVWLVDSTTGALVCSQATGAQGDQVRGWMLHPGEGFAGWVAAHGESLIVPDARSDPRHSLSVDQQTGLDPRSILTSPLRARQGVIGVLQVVDLAVGRFGPADQTLLESLAATAAIAIDNARLYGLEKEQVAALAHALEQQRELDRLKDAFIQNVSHELRTPVTLAYGYAALLYEGGLGELNAEQLESIEIITRRLQQLTKLIDDIKAILETSTRPASAEPVNLVDLTQAQLIDFRVSAQAAGLALSIDVAPDLPPVLGEPLRLTQVLDNLLGNALKFTPAGGRIDVRLFQEAAHITLEVADTGVGIPADQIDRIFERFYQVDGSMSRRYGGTGLGLSLVKEIVESIGGSVHCESQLGQGAIFSVHLPIATVVNSQPIG